MTRTKNTFVILCILSIGTFLWRAFTPSHEYPMRTMQLLNMGFDVLYLVGVIGCWNKLPQEFRNAGARVLCVAAVIAGVGLWAIRLHNDASWATGHYSFYLEERR